MHTYIRLSGFGWSIVPYAPYLVRRLGDGSDGCISIEAVERQALLDPRGDNVAGTLEGLADVEASRPCQHRAGKREGGSGVAPGDRHRAPPDPSRAGGYGAGSVALQWLRPVYAASSSGSIVFRCSSISRPSASTEGSPVFMS